MKFFDYIRFGLKNISRQKARTFLTIFAVMIGAISVVVMLTLVSSAKSAVIGQIESAGALSQVTVSSNTDVSGDDVFNTGGGSDSAKKLDDALYAEIKAIPHVQSSARVLGAWQLRAGALKGGDSKRVSFDQTVGNDPGAATEQQLAAGRNLNATDKRAVVLGANYLDKLGYKDNAQGIIGKTLLFEAKGYTGEGADIPKPPVGNDREAGDAYWKAQQERITTLEAEIVGVTTATSPYERQLTIPLSWARELMVMRHWEMKQQTMGFDPQGRPISAGTPEWELKSDDQFAQQGYSAFILKADDVDNVNSVAEAVRAKGLGAATAQEMIAQILKAFNVLGLALGAIGAIALIVAAIGVINTMVMATLERTREIGVMRACGATKGAVRRLFTFEASLLGFWGGVFGVAVGYGLVYAAKTFGADALAAQGISSDVIAIPLGLAAATVAATTVIGMLAGYGPAVRAARLNPVEALRYE